MRLLLLVLGLSFLTLPAFAQEETETERRVRALIAEEGIHVVHLWAPWCHNSVRELGAFWYDAVEANPEVSFTFVTVYNDGRPARDRLDRYAIPERVLVLGQPDRGPSNDKRNRRREFLGLPVTWTPTTWIFHRGGELAYAVNYGELDEALLQAMLDNVRKDWSH